MADKLPFAWIDAHDVERELNYGRLFGAIERAFADSPGVAPRVSLPYQGRSPQSAGTLLLMAAIQPDALAGVKIITYNVHRSGGAIKYIYVALDPASGALLALIDGESLSTRRTAAVSVVAAMHMAKREPGHILIVGTGPVARELIWAYAAAYPQAQIHLWGRNSDAAGAVAEEASSRGMPVKLSPRLDEAVRVAGIVSCATSAAAPLIKGALLRSDAHVDLIGGFTPLMREADDDVTRRAGLVAADNTSAITEAGDLCQPVAAGILRSDAVVPLESLLRAPAKFRAEGPRLTVFKSVGNAVFDLAAAKVLIDALA